MWASWTQTAPWVLGSQRTAATTTAAAAAGRHGRESPPRPCLLPRAHRGPTHSALLGARAGTETRQPRDSNVPSQTPAP